jgi:hypothetical protein
MTPARTDVLRHLGFADPEDRGPTLAALTLGSRFPVLESDLGCILNIDLLPALEAIGLHRITLLSNWLDYTHARWEMSSFACTPD